MNAALIVGASALLNLAIFYRLPWCAVVAGVVFAVAIHRMPT